MAAKTATVAGNWSNAATWGGVAWADGDIATINVAVTMDVDVIAGASGAVATLAVTVANSGSLTLAVDKTLRCRGDLVVNGPTTGHPLANVRMTMLEGSKVIYDANAAAGVKYTYKIAGASSQFPLLRVRGTAAKHCTWMTDVSGGGLPAWYGTNASTGQASIDAEYLDFVDCGDATQNAWRPFVGTTDNNYVRMVNVTMTRCGQLAGGSINPGATLILDHFKTFDSKGTYAIELTGTTNMTTGTRSLADCAFDKKVSFIGPRHFTILRTVFVNIWNILVHPWTLFEGNFFRDVNQGAMTVCGSMKDCYYVEDSNNTNPHGFTASTLDQDVLYDGIVVEAPIGGAGDLIFAHSPASPRVTSLRNCILLPCDPAVNATAESPGKIFGMLVGANATGDIEHCTYAVWESGETGVNTGETYLGRAGQIQSLRSNLAWRRVAGTAGYKFNRLPASTVQDPVLAANADYNWGWNIAAGSALKGYNAENAGTPLFSTGTPGVHDGSGDPGFVDRTRNLATWATLKGSVAVTDALRRADAMEMLAADTSLIADLVSWVKAGFAPTNSAMSGASHDAVSPTTTAGSTPGAVSVSATPEPLARIDAWDSRVHYTHLETGTNPYILGPERKSNGLINIESEGQEHYDPVNCILEARDYCVRKNLPPTDWSTELGNEVIRYRDRWVLPNNGILSWVHRYPTGLSRHYRETGDALSLTAVDLMTILSTSTGLDGLSVSRHMATYESMQNVRENAFQLLALIDREWSGLAVHPLLDACATCAIAHCDQWTAPPGTYWATWNKPFMTGIALRAMIAYWSRFQNTAVPARAAIVAQIPGRIIATCDWLWDNGWVPPATVGGSGGVKYQTPAGADKPNLNGNVMQSVISNSQFTGQSALSTVDNYYKYAAMTPDGAASCRILAYEGATRKFTVYTGFGNPPLAVGKGFSIKSGIEGSGEQASYPLNPMVAPAFAWAYWYTKRILADSAGAARHRDRHDAMFDGQSMARGGLSTIKQYNQALMWSVAGYDYRARGDSEWANATVFTFQGPATGANGPHSVKSRPFRISIPHGVKLDAPVAITATSSSGRGVFTSAILNTNRREAMLTFTPDVLDAGTTVTITAVGTGLTASGTVAYLVGTPNTTTVTTYTLTGPTTGGVNVDSLAFTATLGAGVVVGAIRITPAVSGLAGTFSPAFLDLTDGERSGEFVFTPTAVGTGGISVTDNSGLTDPGTIFYSSTQDAPPPPPPVDPGDPGLDDETGATTTYLITSRGRFIIPYGG